MQREIDQLKYEVRFLSLHFCFICILRANKTQITWQNKTKQNKRNGSLRKSWTRLLTVSRRFTSNSASSTTDSSFCGANMMISRNPTLPHFGNIFPRRFQRATMKVSYIGWLINYLTRAKGWGWGIIRLACVGTEIEIYVTQLTNQLTHKTTTLKNHTRKNTHNR